MIRDTGPGIAEENLERIWDPDFTTKSSGTGLGLAMVRQTVEVHHGRATARNHPDGGAVFLIELPLQSPSLPPETP
jgi:signal transduction histidine kinase